MSLQQRRKSAGGRAVWREGWDNPDYLAKVVSVEGIFNVVARHGPGDRVAAWVARQQLGLSTAAQLHAAGLDNDAITVRRHRGGLRQVHRGVYLHGASPLLPLARELAAVLACGHDAVVSYRAAAVLWRLAATNAGEATDVTVEGGCRPRPGIEVHRVAHLDARDRRSVRGIPVTSPARTLVDFAAQAAPHELEQAIAEARVKGLVGDRELERAITRAPGRPGVAALKAQLTREGGPQWTHDGAQRRLLDLVRAARLPAPQTEVVVEGFPADLFWERERLIVETDGYEAHGQRRAFERDRRRDQVHIAAGYRVIRVTWRQLQEEPLAVIATIASALRAGE